MPTIVTYPKVSLEMSTGKISRWLVAEGETVRTGQILFEIDSDKAAVEVESTVSGIIANMVGESIEVDVGAAVASIYAPEEALQSSPPSPQVIALTAKPASGVAGVAATVRKLPNPTPLARRLARETGISLENLTGSGPRGRIQKRDVIENLASIKQSLSATARGDARAAEHGSHEQRGEEPLHKLWLRRGVGIPLVLLHGFGADLDNWRGMLATIRNDTPILALDLPCHGRSTRALPESFDAIAAMIEESLAAENIGPLVLAGHSFGGALAARIAARGVLDLRGLCLFAPAGLGPEINEAFLAGLLRARSAGSLRPWLELLCHDPATISEGFLKAVIDQRRDEEQTVSMQAFAERFFPDGTQSFSIRSDLARLMHPVRVVFGRQDRILRCSDAYRLPGNVALHAVDNCGHLPHLEHPRLATAILEEIRRAS